jgi:hypothetical protein
MKVTPEEVQQILSEKKEFKVGNEGCFLEQKIGYFLQGEKPNVTIDNRESPLHSFFWAEGELIFQSYDEFDYYEAPLKDCTIHLYRLEDAEFEKYKFTEMQTDLIEGCNVDDITFEFIKYCWVENICLVPEGRQGEGIKFIDI